MAVPAVVRVGMGTIRGGCGTRETNTDATDFHEGKFAEEVEFLFSSPFSDEYRGEYS